MNSFRMIKDLLFVSDFRGGGFVFVISFQEDTAKMRSLPIGGCHYFLSIIYVWNQSKRKNKHQHDDFYSCQETSYCPFEFLYSLALRRAEICKEGNAGGRDDCQHQPLLTDSLVLTLLIPSPLSSMATQSWAILSNVQQLKM